MNLALCPLRQLATGCGWVGWGGGSNCPDIQLQGRVAPSGQGNLPEKSTGVN